MKKITLLLVFTFLSLITFSQTIYQLDYMHNYVWEDDDWLRTTEEYYEYDIGGIKATDVLNRVSTDGVSFTDNFRHTKSYNSNNLILVDLKEISNGSSWMNNIRITKMYDPTDYMLQELEEIHNGTSWENVTKTDNSFNEAEQTEESLYYDKFEAGNWVLYRQTLSAITQTGVEEEVWIRDFISGVLVRNNKTISIIENGQFSGEIYQNWDDIVMGWINDEKIQLSYIDGLQHKVESFSWDVTSMPPDWEDEPNDRTTYIRDDPTYSLIILQEENYSGSWINGSRLLYTSDGDDNFITSSTEIWDESLGSNGEWFTYSFTSYTYDANNNNTQSIYQYDFNETGLENSLKIDRFWSEATALSVSFNSLESVSLYPNPTTDVINVKFKSPTSSSSEVKLYDMQGKLIHNKIIEGGSRMAEIPIKYKENGMYMLQINTKESTQTYKIVKGN